MRLTAHREQRLLVFEEVDQLQAELVPVDPAEHAAVLVGGLFVEDLGRADVGERDRVLQLMPAGRVGLRDQQRGLADRAESHDRPGARSRDDEVRERVDVLDVVDEPAGGERMSGDRPSWRSRSQVSS